MENVGKYRKYGMTRCDSSGSCCVNPYVNPIRSTRDEMRRKLITVVRGPNSEVSCAGK